MLNALIKSPSVEYFFAVLIAFISALFIIMPFHEFAHAFAASKEGDYTARAMKRYTLAPLSHIDTTGFLLLLFFGFGYAKPVPVNPLNLKHGRRSQIFVALAGVVTNLLLGILSALIYGFLLNVWPELFLRYGFLSLLYNVFFEYMILLNFVFVFFNILPIYPLDGFRLVEACTKPGNGYVEFMKRYGFFILLALLLTSALDYYLTYTGIWLGDKFTEWFVKLFALI